MSGTSQNFARFKAYRQKNHDKSVVGKSLSVAQYGFGVFTKGDAVDEVVAGGDVIALDHFVFVDVDGVADVRDKRIIFGNAHTAGKALMQFKVAILAVNGNKNFGLTSESISFSSSLQACPETWISSDGL